MTNCSNSQAILEREPQKAHPDFTKFEFWRFQNQSTRLWKKFCRSSFPWPLKQLSPKDTWWGFFRQLLGSPQAQPYLLIRPKIVNETENAYVHFENNFLVTVIFWVNGEQLPFAELKWMKTKPLFLLGENSLPKCINSKNNWRRSILMLHRESNHADKFTMGFWKMLS